MIARRIPHFFQFIVSRFVHDNCLQVAASLAYTTLLSIVPLMAVMLNVFTAFPAFKALEKDIREFVFSNFMPATGEMVDHYLQTFTQHTSQLTAVGAGALIVTALMMLRTIDTSLNRIWRAQRSTSFLRNFIVYWAILTLGPFLVGVGIVLTSYLMSLPWLGVDKTMRQSFLVWLPFLSTGIAFTLLYLLIPNRRVPWHSALMGGIFAALLFEFSKRGFALYVTHSEVYQTIYGAMATIPIFLLWIYLSWVLILLGAEVTYCLSNFKWEDKYAGMHDSDNYFMRAYRMLGHLWQAQRDGQALSINTLMQHEGWKDEGLTRAILNTLLQAHWVYQTEDDLCGVARDLNDTCLLDLYRLMSGGLSKLPASNDAWSQNLYPILEQVNEHNQTVMALPLRDLYAKRDK